MDKAMYRMYGIYHMYVSHAWYVSHASHHHETYTLRVEARQTVHTARRVDLQQIHLLDIRRYNVQYVHYMTLHDDSRQHILQVAYAS